MQLHQLQSIKQKAKPRIGRGGKRGTTSGRGTKGQKSRSGHRIRPAERDLILRLPKRRGFRNKPKSAKPFILNLRDISNRLKHLLSDKKELTVSRDTLIQFGLLSPKYRGGIKLLGKGEIKSAITFKGFSVSTEAEEKIKKAGGKMIK